MRLVGVGPQPFVSVGLVFLIIYLKPNDLAFPLERKNVRGDPIQKPTVMADDQRAPRQIKKRPPPCPPAPRPP